MPFSEAAKIKAARLEQEAKNAIAKYNRDIEGSTEPQFPNWAYDLLALLDKHDRMAVALEVARNFIAIANGETAPMPKIALAQIDEALYQAGFLNFHTLTRPQADIWAASKPESPQ